MIRVEIPGRPVPHPRITIGEMRGRRTSSRWLRYAAYRAGVILQVKNQLQHAPTLVRPFTGRVGVRCEIHITGSGMDKKNRKWDTTNVWKSIEDALRGLLWVDDWQVLDAHPTIVDQAREDMVVVEAWEW